MGVPFLHSNALANSSKFDRDPITLKGKKNAVEHAVVSSKGFRIPGTKPYPLPRGTKAAVSVTIRSVLFPCLLIESINRRGMSVQPYRS